MNLHVYKSYLLHSFILECYHDRIMSIKCNNILLGNVCMITALLLYVVSDTLCKSFLVNYSASQVTFFRGLARLLPIIVACAVIRHNPIKTTRLNEHLVRSTIASTNTFLFMCAYKYSSMTAVYAIGYTSSLFVLLFGYLMLKEKVRTNSIIAVFIGLIGAMIILQPSISNHYVNIGAAFALTASIVAALNSVLIRRLSTTEHILTIVFYHDIISLMFSLPLAVFAWTRITNYHHLLIGFGIIGIISAVSQYMISYALKTAKISDLASTNYVTIIPVILVDSFYWHVIPSAEVIFGMFLIVICNYVVIRKGKKC